MHVYTHTHTYTHSQAVETDMTPLLYIFSPVLPFFVIKFNITFHLSYLSKTVFFSRFLIKCYVPVLSARPFYINHL